MQDNVFDFIIVGAGIIGLTLARELALSKAGRILVLEKEDTIGRHASGRNSGVVHAGIYYSNESLKARFCVSGSKRLLAYVEQHQLPVLKCGKVIVANRPESVPELSRLLNLAKSNGVRAERISLSDLAEIEPQANSHEWALWSPDTAIIDSKAVLDCLVNELKELGVTFEFCQEAVQFNLSQQRLRSKNNSWQYGFLFNSAGTYADKIAHAFGVGLNYQILPFKGIYRKAADSFATKISRLIYPVPDPKMPFLGVHITRTVDGKVLFGPTAMPAFGRENYPLLGGIAPAELPSIGWNLSKMFIRNPGGFRRYVRHELKHYRRKSFYEEARTLVRELNLSDVGGFYKVGIRAQLVDKKKSELVTDFALEKGEKSLHVLNAISPAFTSAFAIAPYLIEQST